MIGIVGAPYTVLTPMIAGQILRGGAHTLGFLMAASGVGALICAVGLVLRNAVVGISRPSPELRGEPAVTEFNPPPAISNSGKPEPASLACQAVVDRAVRDGS